MSSIDPLHVWVARDGRSERALARELELNNSYVSGILRGREKGSMATLERIANLIGVDPDDVAEIALARRRERYDPDVVGLSKAIENLLATEIAESDYANTWGGAL